MKDLKFPPRLTDSMSDDFVRALLAAGSRNEAEPSQAERAVARYMRGRSAAARHDSSRLSGINRPLRRLSKRFGVIALVGAICLGWMLRGSTETVPRVSTPSSAQSSVQTSVRPSPGAPAPLLETPGGSGVDVDDLPSVPEVREWLSTRTGAAPPGDSAHPGSTPWRAQAAAPASLHEELALVEAARSALTRSAVDECLRTLDVYDRRFRRGVLAHEATAIRIEALVARGERDRARTFAEAFLSANPESAYSSRIQSLLEGAP